MSKNRRLEDTRLRCDRRSGAFCDPWILTWAQNSTLTWRDKYCSDCWLGVQSCQLSNPVGYDQNLADNFKSLTAICQASSYSYTPPTSVITYSAFPTPTTTNSAVGWDWTATSSVENQRQCKSTHIVEAKDDCNRIASAYMVSTFNLVNANNLDLYCQGLVNLVGSSLCIPDMTCDTYAWRPQDSCDDIVKMYPKISIPQFLSWNPSFNSLCQNSAQFADFQVCVRFVHN